MKKLMLSCKRLVLFLSDFAYEKVLVNRHIFQTKPAKDLYEKGYFHFSKPLKGKELISLLTDFDDTLKANQIEKSGQKNGRFYSTGIVRPILNGHLSEITSILDDYFGANRWKVEISYYQHTLPETNLDNVPGGEFHVDDNKTNIKYFIYLKVTLKNGPFRSCPLPTAGN